MLKSKNMVNGVNVDVNKLSRCCKGCALGKQHQNSFPKTSNNLTKQPLEIIYSPVCGPMNVDSIGGSKYFVTFIDDFSRYTTVYTMKNENEVFEKFKEHVAYVENQTNFKVKFCVLIMVGNISPENSTNSVLKKVFLDNLRYHIHHSKMEQQKE